MFSGYETVVSSSHAVAKGVLTGPDQLHLSYVHSPIRYAWDLQHQYLREAHLEKGLKSVLARLILHYVRLWDVRTPNGVDAFAANSRFIARRIHKVYGRVSKVIYPPVDVAAFTLREQKDDFYLTASRMVPYKKIPLIIEAFAAMPDKRLVVIGAGPEFARCKAGGHAQHRAAGLSVLRRAARPHAARVGIRLRRRGGFRHRADRGAGLRTPVIAFGKGGACENYRWDPCPCTA